MPDSPRIITGTLLLANFFAISIRRIISPFLVMIFSSAVLSGDSLFDELNLRSFRLSSNISF